MAWLLACRSLALAAVTSGRGGGGVCLSRAQRRSPARRRNASRSGMTPETISRSWRPYVPTSPRQSLPAGRSRARVAFERRRRRFRPDTVLVVEDVAPKRALASRRGRGLLGSVQGCRPRPTFLREGLTRGGSGYLAKQGPRSFSCGTWSRSASHLSPEGCSFPSTRWNGRRAPAPPKSCPWTLLFPRP